MLTRKNKILTMLFGLLPGAGHMFMGFMQMGVSYMLLFFGGIAVILFLDNLFYLFGFLGFFIPIIWCYAFFDCLNRCYASDEEFWNMKDHFLFSEFDIPKFHFDFRLGKYARLFMGWILVVSGGIFLCRNFLNILEDCGLLDWNSPIYRFLYSTLNRIPQFLTAMAIILIGLRLIFGKRKELKELKALIDPTIGGEEDFQEFEEAEHHE